MVCRINGSTRLSIRQSGFLLLHMLVYLSVLTLIVLYVMQWAVSIFMHYNAMTKQGNQLLALTVACDVWVRDMRGLSGTIYHHECDWIWKSQNKYVCWRVMNNNLVRAEGSYTQGTWYTQSQSLMAEQVESFSIIHDSQHHLAHCIMQSPSWESTAQLEVCKRAVFLCNEH